MPRRYLNGSLAVLDHELAFAAVAADYAAMLGWRPRDLVGVAALELVDLDAPAARVAHRARMRMIGAGGVVDDVATLIARDGERIRFAHTARAVMGGELYVVSGEPLSAELELLDALEPSSPALIGEWLTKPEAEAYTKYSASTLDRAVHNGELEAGGTPGRRRFKREWLDAWLVGLGVLVALVVMLGALALADAIPVNLPLLEDHDATHHALRHARIVADPSAWLITTSART